MFFVLGAGRVGQQHDFVAGLAQQFRQFGHVVLSEFQGR
jgi:hypothetical protein